MSYDNYSCLSVHVNRGVAFVTFDHPPRNAIDSALWPEIEARPHPMEKVLPAATVVIDEVEFENWGSGGVQVSPEMLKALLDS
jgi:enoyl-CoA hydratase/carnithine racemase